MHRMDNHKVFVIAALIGSLPALCQAETVLRVSHAGDNLDYYPTASQVQSETNPYPHKNLRVLADRWEALHPGVRIELVNVPSKLAYRQWCVANFVAGTVPHIIYQNMGIYRDADFPKGWVIQMDPFLERPNLYVPGNSRWNDLFYPVWQNAMRSLDGKIYWVGVDTIGVGIICNLDILEEVGVTALPKTLGELIEACEKVRAAGYLTYLPGLYVDCVLASVVWGDLIPEMDVLHRDGIIDVQEMVRAVEKGIFRTDDGRMHEQMRLAKLLMDQYAPGSIPMGASRFQYRFLQGKTAFFEAISPYMRRIEDDTRRTFRYKVIPFPELTVNDSRYGGRPLAGAGNAGYTSTWQITNAAVRDDVVELCVDWLMFLTTPENAEFLVNEIGFTIPGVRGTEHLPLYDGLMQAALKEMEEPGYLDWHALVLFTLSAEVQDALRRTYEDLLFDTITIDEAVERVDFWLRRTHERIMRRNAALWDTEAW